jgi:hypothetical protein
VSLTVSTAQVASSVPNKDAQNLRHVRSPESLSKSESASTAVPAMTKQKKSSAETSNMTELRAPSTSALSPPALHVSGMVEALDGPDVNGGLADFSVQSPGNHNVQLPSGGNTDPEQGVHVAAGSDYKDNDSIAASERVSNPSSGGSGSHSSGSSSRRAATMNMITKIRFKTGLSTGLRLLQRLLALVVLIVCVLAIVKFLVISTLTRQFETVVDDVHHAARLRYLSVRMTLSGYSLSLCTSASGAFYSNHNAPLFRRLLAADASETIRRAHVLFQDHKASMPAKSLKLYTSLDAVTVSSWRGTRPL